MQTIEINVIFTGALMLFPHALQALSVIQIVVAHITASIPSGSISLATLKI